MNEHDRRTYLAEIFQILKPRLQQWTMFEVLQFLMIIRSPFSDMVRKHQVNGNVLLNLAKLEKLLQGELNATNILPYLKMVAVVQQIRGTNPFAEHASCKDDAASRPRPRSMMIDERLLRAIQTAMQRITDRPLILWNTEQIVELLKAMHFTQFVPTVQSCSIDGFILLCVAGDWDCLVRLKKYMPTQQIQEINFVSQVLLAENYFLRFYKEEQGESPISSKPALELKKIDVSRNSKENMLAVEEPELGMLKQSAEELDDNNDFFLAYGEMGNSTLKESEPSEDGQLGRIHSQEEMLESKPINHFFHSQNLTEERRGASQSLDRNANSLRVNSTTFNEQMPEKAEQSSNGITKAPQLPPIQEDSSPEQSRLAESYYPEESRRESKLAESYVPAEGLAQSYVPDNQLSESRYGESVVESQYANSVVGSNNNGESLLISSIEQPSRLNDLRSVTLSLPFDLLNFESLHLISLVEMSELTHQELANEDFRKKTYSIRGVRFGRDKQNDYSYPDELSISAKHAIIVFRDEAFHLQDLGSKTGTFKQLTTRTQLHEGMKLQLSHVIEFTVDKISSKEDEGLVTLVFQKPQTMPRYQARIKNGVKLTIGRNENCSIPIDGKKLSISMKHAEILYEGGRFFFCDISQNGSFVRLSQKGVKSEPMRLERGDRFRISSKKMFLVSDIQTPGRLY